LRNWYFFVRACIGSLVPGIRTYYELLGNFWSHHGTNGPGSTGTRLLAASYFLSIARPSTPLNASFGFLLTLDNIPDSVISQCHALNNRLRELSKMCGDIMKTRSRLEVGMQKHVNAFMTKYSKYFQHLEADMPMNYVAS
jgi:hypothetical protein